MSTFASSPLPTRRAFARADELLDELVVDGLVHEQARGRGATLAGRAEGAPDRAVDREVDVRVVHDEDRVLAAHLQVQALERRRAGREIRRPTSVEPVNETTLTSGCGPAGRRPRRPSP